MASLAEDYQTEPHIIHSKLCQTSATKRAPCHTLIQPRKMSHIWTQETITGHDLALDGPSSNLQASRDETEQAGTRGKDDAHASTRRYLRVLGCFSTKAIWSHCSTPSWVPGF